MLPDHIDDVHFGLEWANDNRTLFYTRTDSAQRPDRIFRHTLGMPNSSDAMVHHQPDVLFGLGIGKTKDDRFLLIGDESFTQSTWYYIDARAGGVREGISAGRSTSSTLSSTRNHFTSAPTTTRELQAVRAPDRIRGRRIGRGHATRLGADDDFDVFRNHWW